jgi:hypothetical protein
MTNFPEPDLSGTRDVCRAAEALFRFRIRGKMLRQNLDRHVAPKLRVARYTSPIPPAPGGAVISYHCPPMPLSE